MVLIDFTRADVQGLLSEMSDVQYQVYQDARMWSDDIGQWRETLFGMNRDTTDQTLRELVGTHGCGSSQVALGSQVRDTIDQAAKDSSKSIGQTWNRDVASAILDIGRETPTANYRTYRSRLFGDTVNSIHAGFDNWASNRGMDKLAQIVVTETASAINQATGLFYQRNPQLDGTAQIVPEDAVCEVCQALVAANPYESSQAAYDAGPVPAHVGCVHTVQNTGRVLADDCSDVWKGEDE